MPKHKPTTISVDPHRSQNSKEKEKGDQEKKENVLLKDADKSVQVGGVMLQGVEDTSECKGRFLSNIQVRNGGKTHENKTFSSPALGGNIP